MRGSIKQRGNSWRVVVDVGVDPNTGKRQQHTETFRLKKDAERRLSEIMHEADSGSYTKPARMTVADFLRQWQRDYVASNTRARTAEEYAKKIEGNIIPEIGAIQLTALRPDHLQSLYRKALESGRKDGKGGLSPTTVLHLHRILREALGHALRWGLVGRNIALAVDPPRPSRREMATIGPEDIQKVLNACQGTIWFVAFHLAIYTGLRRSELLGLRWKDVDLVGGSLSVVQTMHQLGNKQIVFSEPKTAKSKRKVSLSPRSVLVLRGHRERREAEQAYIGGKSLASDLVFSMPDGSPITPYALTQRWAALVRKIGLQGIRFHDLRHTHATLLLKQGEHPKVVQERLGHATIAVTLDTYSHVLPGMQEAAAARFDDTVAYEVATDLSL